MATVNALGTAEARKVEATRVASPGTRGDSVLAGAGIGRAARRRLDSHPAPRGRDGAGVNGGFADGRISGVDVGSPNRSCNLMRTAGALEAAAAGSVVAGTGTALLTQR